MSTRPPLTAEERDLLAAELAMGLLGGDERAEAEALAVRDREFRAAFARWTVHLAPMLDEVQPVDPPAAAWSRIESRMAGRIESPATPAPSNVVHLRRKVNLWRGYSLAATAIAASLALVLVARPGAAPTPVPTPTPAPNTQSVTPTLVAMMQSDAGPARLVATYDPASRRLIVAAAAGMAPAAGHAHELWLIPASGGKPHPMGIVSAVAPNKMDVPIPMAPDVREGATFAISVEPPSGSPTGAPTGPVIASGKLTRA